MLGENHSVHHEFPEHHDLIDRLVVENMHFKRIVVEYNTLDKEIRGIEVRDSPISDDTLSQMKKKRGHLKDKIYQILMKNS